MEARMSGVGRSKDDKSLIAHFGDDLSAVWAVTAFISMLPHWNQGE